MLVRLIDHDIILVSILYISPFVHYQTSPDSFCFFFFGWGSGGYVEEKIAVLKEQYINSKRLAQKVNSGPRLWLAENPSSSILF